jgi:hypothetical protein
MRSPGFAVTFTYVVSMEIGKGSMAETRDGKKAKHPARMQGIPNPKTFGSCFIEIVLELKLLPYILELAHYGICRYRRRAFARYFLQSLRHIDRRTRRTGGIRGEPTISTNRRRLAGFIRNACRMDAHKRR